MGKFEIIDCPISYLSYNKIRLNLPDFKEHNDYYKSYNLGIEAYWGNYKLFREHLEFINTSINNKYITIKDPVTNKDISTDLYFIVLSEPNVLGYNSFICYYFRNKNIILVSPTGSGLHPMNVAEFSLINFNVSKIFSMYSHGCLIDDFAYDKILKVKKRLDDMDVNEFNTLMDMPVEIKTFYGFSNNIGHQIFNDYTGLYLLQKTNIFASTDKFIIGPHDCLNFKEYFNYYFPTKQCIIHDDITSYDNYIGRGVLYKYNYNLVSYKTSKFIKSSIFYNNLLTISPSIKENIITLRKHPGLKLLIIIREGSRNLLDQKNQIVKLIDLIKKHFKHAKIILGGFVCDNKSKDTTPVGYFNQSYTDINDLYMKTSNYIVNNSIHKNDIININGLTFNESLLISNECNFGLYTHGSGATIGAWVCRIPGITFGFHDMNRYKGMDPKICETSKDLLVYLTDPNIITFDIKYDHEYTYNMNMDKFAEYVKENIYIKLGRPK
jgi:hypothetical protein